jgi:putative nucleotidyltransferase with HDIG domain
MSIIKRLHLVQPAVEALHPRRVAGNAAAPAKTSASDELRSWTTRLFFGVQIVLAVAILALEVPKLEGDLEVLAVLIALDVLVALVPIVLYGESYVSVGFVISLAIIILFGPPGVVLAAPAVALAGAARKRTLDYKVVTNGARFVVIYFAAAVAYTTFGEVSPPKPDLGMALGAAAATAVEFSLSIALVIASAKLRTGQSFAEAWDKSRWVGPHYAALGLVGLALTSAYISLGLFGVAAFVMPALMMRLAMKQYVDKTAENVLKLQDQNKQLKSANVEIRRMSDELRESYDGTLEALVNALDARDQETKGHSIRVSNYMMEIARQLGIREGTQDWLDMQRGSLLHDVGKIGVIDSILLKPGKLTPEEWEQMRRHPEIGYEMLRQVRFLQGAAEIILAHHERWDGNGYPRGLGGEDIPLGARIFPVVDTFDAITSDRPYRKAKSSLEAMNEILRCSGSQFDPLVVEAFLDTYETWVREMEVLHAAPAVSTAA